MCKERSLCTCWCIVISEEFFNKIAVIGYRHYFFLRWPWIQIPIKPSAFNRMFNTVGSYLNQQSISLMYIFLHSQAWLKEYLLNYRKKEGIILYSLKLYSSWSCMTLCKILSISFSSFLTLFCHINIELEQYGSPTLDMFLNIPVISSEWLCFFFLAEVPSTEAVTPSIPLVVPLLSKYRQLGIVPDHFHGFFFPMVSSS